MKNTARLVRDGAARVRDGAARVEGILLAQPADDASRLAQLLVQPDSDQPLPAVSSASGLAPPTHTASSSPAPPLDPSSASVAHVKRLMLKELPVKEQVWVLMNDPHSSRAAQLIAATVMTVIIISCAAFVAQTLPEYANSRSPAWGAIEYACIFVFSLELGLRLWSCPNRLDFFNPYKNALNIIDLAAILPFFLELALSSSAASGSSIVRVVRLIRIFRVFKISRYLPWVRVFTNALYLSSQPLVMLLLMILLASVLFSSAIYYAERGEWSAEVGAWQRRTTDGGLETSPYQSIPESFWWCIVTMTTVGYGDAVPTSPLGRFIAALAALSGILVLAIPVSIISTNFNSEFSKLARQREQVKARVLLLKKHFRCVIICDRCVLLMLLAFYAPTTSPALLPPSPLKHTNHSAKSTGLDAVMDEVEDIVLRNTQELKGELDALFQVAQLELTEELKELLRMAYERRRQLHLAALSAGRVHVSQVYGMAAEEGGGGGLVPLEEGDEAAMMPGRGSRREGGGGEGGGAADATAAGAAAAAELQVALRRSMRLTGDGGGGGAAAGGAPLSPLPLPPSSSPQADPYSAPGGTHRGGKF